MGRAPVLGGMKASTRRRFVAQGALALAALQAPGAFAQAPAPIHVRSFGDGERVWVLLHPFGASGRFWEVRAPLLAVEHGVQIVAPDLPSHGQSEIAARFDYAS